MNKKSEFRTINQEAPRPIHHGLIAALIPILVAASCGSAAAVKKVLFVGDSITKHGPLASLGWTGDYGMAATSANKDYVHLLFAKISGSQSTVPELVVNALGGGTIAGRLAILESLKKVGADLVFIQLGENDGALTSDQFTAQYDSLVSALKNTGPGVRVFCASVWKGTSRDAAVKGICVKRGAVFVDISQAAANPANSALAEGHFKDAGVNWHPGNAGQQAYADAFWKSFVTTATAVRPIREIAMAGALAFSLSPEAMVVGVGFAGRHRVEVIRPDGKIAARFEAEGPASHSLSRKGLPTGLYILRASGGKGESQERVVSVY